jgi:hypothetical protein
VPLQPLLASSPAPPLSGHHLGRRRRPPFTDIDERKVVPGPCQTEKTRKEGRMLKGVLTGAVLLLVAVVILQSLPDFQRYIQLRDM